MRFATATVVGADLEAVWALHDDLGGIVELAPDWLDAEVHVLEGRATPLAAGTRFEIALRPAGIALPATWRGRIAAVRRAPRRRSFVDVGVATPFRRWRHRHVVRVVDGGTQVADVIDLETLRGTGPLVRIGLALAFRDRHRRLRDRFGPPR